MIDIRKAATLYIIALFLPILIGSCSRPIAPVIKQLLIQEQKAKIELRIHKRKALQEKILNCDHKFTLKPGENCYLRCEYCAVNSIGFSKGDF